MLCLQTDRLDSMTALNHLVEKTEKPQGDQNHAFIMREKTAWCRQRGVAHIKRAMALLAQPGRF